MNESSEWVLVRMTYRSSDFASRQTEYYRVVMEVVRFQQGKAGVQEDVRILDHHDLPFTNGLE